MPLTWQSPIGAREVARVTVRIPFEIILMLRFGLPEIANRFQFGDDLTRPEA